MDKKKLKSIGEQLIKIAESTTIKNYDVVCASGAQWHSLKRFLDRYDNQGNNKQVYFEGQTFYRIRDNFVEKLTYLCTFPNLTDYHILIGRDKQPIRMYKDELERLFISKNDALNHNIAKLKSAIERNKKRIISKSEINN